MTLLVFYFQALAQSGPSRRNKNKKTSLKTWIDYVDYGDTTQWPELPAKRLKIYFIAHSCRKAQYYLTDTIYSISQKTLVTSNKMAAPQACRSSINPSFF